MAWNNLINTANSAEDETCVHGNIHLNQWCSMGKRPLEMKDSDRDELAAQLKNGAIFHGQSYDKINSNYPADKTEISEKARKDKKNKKSVWWERRDNWQYSFGLLGSNVI